MSAKVFRGLIWEDPERMGGTPCFYGTRVPVQYLFEFIEFGEGLEAFLEAYDVPREQVLDVLRVAEEGLVQKLAVA